MAGILTVAEKELRDFCTGRRFLMLFAIIVAMCLVGVLSGLQDYHSQLDQYKQQEASNQKVIADMQKQIADAEARGDDPAQIQNMKENLDMMSNQWVPSIMNIFYAIAFPMSMAGAILAIVMGFDLISREKEEGSLKQLLTRPIYRDTVIIGKAIAGLAAIIVMTGAAFLIVIAGMLLLNVVPTGDQLLRVAIFFLATVMYIAAFFAISLMVSTLTRSSTMSILCLLGLFLVFYMVPSVTYQVTSVITGPCPVSPDTSSYYRGADGNFTVPTGEQMAEMNQIQWKYQNDSIAYFKKQQQITDLLSYLSPQSCYNTLNNVMLYEYRQQSIADSYSNHLIPNKRISAVESLAIRWSFLLALLVEVVAALGLSYLFFMRADVA